MWEYLIVDHKVVDYKWDKEDKRTRFFSEGNKEYFVKDIQNAKEMSGMLNYFGKDGWELVTITNAGQPYFKRKF